MRTPCTATLILVALAPTHAITDMPAIARWAAMLSGAPGSSEFWSEGVVPPLHFERFRGGKLKPGNRTWRGACPTPANLHHPEPWASAPSCHDYWPTGMDNYACHVLSIGLGDEWSFEDAFIGRSRTTTGPYDLPIPPSRRPPTNCTVDAHDPTRGLRAQHEKHATSEVGDLAAHLRFHYSGLGVGGAGGASAAAGALAGSASAVISAGGKGGGRAGGKGGGKGKGGGASGGKGGGASGASGGKGGSASGASADTRNTYGVIDQSVLLSLDSMVSGLRGGRSPDVLKVDCEGCEWAALAHVAHSGPVGARLLERTKLLFLELHVASSMIPPTPEECVSATVLLEPPRHRTPRDDVASIHSLPYTNYMTLSLTCSLLCTHAPTRLAALVREQVCGRL